MPDSPTPDTPAERALVAAVEALLIACSSPSTSVTRLLAEGSAQDYSVLAAGLLEEPIRTVRASVSLSAARLLLLHGNDADAAAAAWTGSADARYGPAWRP